jgi:hypothetical protein
LVVYEFKLYLRGVSANGMIVWVDKSAIYLSFTFILLKF